ncbi:hypothetical protein DUNSADRAFT_1565 [Dunaliella salina]|uniref:Uncharacterized protein n=1 Tax=Dunaliella salina TaxID=3046 RepID=A0ABQ7FX96_DUNSA|nr:hypothetical protein DUNSADRAFT_1565 [Dunaliella salina]|eukprot:KAF5826974.1 hypothetical protein DUNSADRAFT_1565 [Dunaliella salina]
MARKQHGPELYPQICSSTPTPGQRQARSTSWRPYSGRAGDPDAQQRARNILHDLAGNGLRAAEQELLSTSAAQEESSRGNKRSEKRAPPRRRSSAVSVTWSQTPDVSELAAERGMNRSASPPFLSGEDSLSPQPSFSSLSSARSSSSGTPLRRSSLTRQRSFSSLSSAPSSQPSSGTPLRPSSRLSKPEHTHSKDSSLTVVGARRAILSLSGMPIPAEDITKDTSRTGSEADEYAVPPRPRSRLGLHRSSSSIKTQPELPFESAMGSLSQPLPTVPPQLPLQPPSPVPSKSRTHAPNLWSQPAIHACAQWTRSLSLAPSGLQQREQREGMTHGAGSCPHVYLSMEAGMARRPNSIATALHCSLTSTCATPGCP